MIAALSPRMKHLRTDGRTDGQPVGRLRGREQKEGVQISLYTRQPDRSEIRESERARRQREDAKSSATNRAVRETNEQTDGRSSAANARTNRAARGFSGRLRGCSSLAGPLVAPRGSERLPHRRATARRERQSGCARSLAFFDPPSRPRPPRGRRSPTSRFP